MSSAPCDLLIIGGGIIGLATAREALMSRSGLSVRVVEKEPRIGAHQTTHNSGVIHSGIAYRPGSLKAQTCVAGGRLMTEFCAAHGIPVLRCGKLVVASQPCELPTLERLYRLRHLHRGTHRPHSAMELLRLLWFSLATVPSADTS